MRIGPAISVSLGVIGVSCAIALAQSDWKPVPDITWQPEALKSAPPVEPRFIDFEGGDDNNAGTKESPWQHHPWDANATGQAAACAGEHTYYFRRGVAYRGALVATDSGTADTPIALTVDPAWGDGKASICGSVRIQGPWRRCTGADVGLEAQPTREIPAAGRSQTWYVDLDIAFVPRLLWEVRGEEVTRIPIARAPDWQIADPDDPRSQWWELTGRVLEVQIDLDNVAGFKVGDHITGTGRWVDRDETRDNIERGHNRVMEVGEGFIRIEAWEWKKGEIQRGATITNGTATAKVVKVAGTHEIATRLIDEEHIVQADPEYYVGATMWAESERMPKPDAGKVLGYDPEEHSLRIMYSRGTGGAKQYDRYYLEGLPQFLDSPGEFCYDEGNLSGWKPDVREGLGDHAGRLFLRLPDDRDPNESTIEVARAHKLISIEDQSNITISGLDLRFSNSIACGTPEGRHAALHASLVRLNGTCSGIKVLNCELSHAPAGVVAYPYQEGDVLDQLEVSDNDMHDIDSTAVALSNGRGHYLMKDYGCRLMHVRLLRNRVRNVGYRNLAHWGLGHHALHVEAGELVEIAGNVVDNVWGAGIMSFNGSDYSRGEVERPLIRTLIHHNKVTNSLLGLQDYGGIASWMGGPSYVYCNISGNAVGYKHSHWRRLDRKDWYRTSCYGIGIYVDGQYKGYVFNNVTWGKNNNVNDRIYNSCGFNEAAGFMNEVFNNTIYRFGVSLHKGMFQHNRCYYLGNLMLDIGHKFIQQEPTQKVIEHDNLAYGRNVLNGTPPNFGQLGQEIFATQDEWQATMAAHGLMVNEVGTLAPQVQVADAEAHDFRLRADSAAVDHGVKVFVPWALYAVVGEWGLYKHAADPAVILGENMNWNDEWVDRAMFHQIPRNNLTGHGIDGANFKAGMLEDWVEGALELNGTDQYCDLPDETLKSGYEWTSAYGAQGNYEGAKRVTVDMHSNDFLIEVVLRTREALTSGGIVSKQAESGYSLEVNDEGGVRLTLEFDGSSCSRSSAVAINDGEWHHVIAEVLRAEPEGINIYVDGKVANGTWSGTMNPTQSLSNSGDFTVGRTPGPDEKYYAGMLDFLRVSRGSLSDAETSIEELYQWEFEGPFLRDFRGNEAAGKCRDAGALEYTGH